MTQDEIDKAMVDLNASKIRKWMDAPVRWAPTDARRLFRRLCLALAGVNFVIMPWVDDPSFMAGVAFGCVAAIMLDWSSHRDVNTQN